VKDFTAETAETAEETQVWRYFRKLERCVRPARRLWGNYNCNGVNHNCNFIHVPGGDAAPIAFAISENSMRGSKHFVISEITFAPNVFPKVFCSSASSAVSAASAVKVFPAAS